MLPLVYTNPLAAGLFLAVCLAWLVPEMTRMRRMLAKASRSAEAGQDRGSLAVLLGLQWTGLALNFFLAWFCPAAAIRWQRSLLFGLGLILLLMGVALRWIAIRILGNYFTHAVAVTPGQPVVMGGPYRLIRHPAYSGTFLTMLGVGLAITNWASLVALLLCVFFGHLYRVNMEEKALIRTIGQPYIEYMRRTKRFIPWVF
ncbi:MAG: isoprenylcysteine carboxylmethyltransferase family protein [Anaerolineales bacterium]